MGCHFHLQGIFPTQGFNPDLLNCRHILYHLSYEGSQHNAKSCSNPGIEPTFLMSPALAGEIFTTTTTWEAYGIQIRHGFMPSKFYSRGREKHLGRILKYLIYPRHCVCAGAGEGADGRQIKYFSPLLAINNNKLSSLKQANTQTYKKPLQVA